MNTIPTRRERGFAIPLVILIGLILMTMLFPVFLALRSGKRAPRQLDAQMIKRFVAEGGNQHTLLKIKELRQEFYDALVWSGEYNDLRIQEPDAELENWPPAGSSYSGSEKFGLKHPAFDMPIEDVPKQALVNEEAGDRKTAFKYMDAFIDDLVSLDADGNQMISKEDGDPFTAAYAIRDPDKMGPHRDGISSVKDAFGAEGLIRLSTRVMDTGAEDDPSDDTEEDSIQIVIIGDLQQAESKWIEKSDKLLHLRKIEKIERSRR